MAIVKLLRDFPPGWQSGIEVEIEGKRLDELLKEGSVELLEPIVVPKVVKVQVKEKPVKKVKSKKLNSK